MLTYSIIYNPKTHWIIPLLAAGCFTPSQALLCFRYQWLTSAIHFPLKAVLLPNGFASICWGNLNVGLTPFSSLQDKIKIFVRWLLRHQSQMQQDSPLVLTTSHVRNRLHFLLLVQGGERGLSRQIDGRGPTRLGQVETVEFWATIKIFQP